MMRQPTAPEGKKPHLLPLLVHTPIQGKPDLVAKYEKKEKQTRKAPLMQPW
jgi:hypothetical protein